MEVSIESSVVHRLSSKGILAYVAVRLADGSVSTTAALAGLVTCQTGVMLEGLKELSSLFPDVVDKEPKNKWRCGTVKAGDGVVLQNLDSERFRVFVDDLKKYWDFLNPTLPFQMGGKDGAQIRIFLRDHSDWKQEDWLQALRYRAVSVVKHRNAPRSQPLWIWVARLDEYAAGPLNEYNRPPEGNGNGKAAEQQDRNREAREQFLSRL